MGQSSDDGLALDFRCHGMQSTRSLWLFELRLVERAHQRFGHGCDGSLLVADTLNHTLRRIANGEVSTVVGAPSGAMAIRLGVPGGLFAPWGALAVGPRRYVVTSADAVLFVTLP